MVVLRSSETQERLFSSHIWEVLSQSIPKYGNEERGIPVKGWPERVIARPTALRWTRSMKTNNLTGFEYSGTTCGCSSGTEQEVNDG